MRGRTATGAGRRPFGAVAALANGAHTTGRGMRPRVELNPYIRRLVLGAYRFGRAGQAA